jgi:hypothetical protein
MKFILSVVVPIAFCPPALGQERHFFIGPALSLQQEKSFGGGQSWGIGLRLQKKIDKHWELNTGIKAVNRHYRSNEQINLCALQPGVFCHFARYQVESYGYRTLEVPLGLNRYLIHRGQWEVYFQVNLLSAFDYRSYYGALTPETNTLSYFSSSLTGGMGFSYRVSNGWRLTFEPFLRTVHHQRKDQVLVSRGNNQFSHVDNYGMTVLLMFRW